MALHERARLVVTREQLHAKLTRVEQAPVIRSSPSFAAFKPALFGDIVHNRRLASEPIMRARIFATVVRLTPAACAISRSGTSPNTARHGSRRAGRAA